MSKSNLVTRSHIFAAASMVKTIALLSRHKCLFKADFAVDSNKHLSIKNLDPYLQYRVSKVKGLRCTGVM